MKIKLLLTGAALLVAATNANALVCANCATVSQMAQSNLKQAEDYAETLKQTANQIQSLQNQVESISYQIQNVKQLDSHSWGDTQAQLERLGSIARQGNAMAYSLVDLNTKWNAQFRGNEAWASEVQTNDMVTQQYKDWGDMMEDTSKSALQVANQMASIQKDDESTLTSLQQHSDSATGAVQVAQAGNEIAAQSVRQMQKMQTLIQADMQMTATSISLGEEKEAQMRAATEAKITDPDQLQTNINDGKDWTHLW
ncbi:P-type conjugative transfer protein TrbJ [Enterobacter ludwigii]